MDSCAHNGHRGRAGTLSSSLGLQREVAGRVGRGARVQRAARDVRLGGSHATAAIEEIAQLAGARDVPDTAGIGIVAGQTTGLDNGVGVGAADKVGPGKGRGGQDESRSERSNSHG